MFESLYLGLIAGGALFIGSAVAVLLKRSYAGHKRAIERTTKTVMAFGAGVLLCTLSFNLMEDAYQKGGFDHVTIGFVGGALLFVLGDLWLGRRGSGTELLLGALLDGVPESAVIGIGVAAGQGLGLLVTVAVFVSNLPEGFSGAGDMLHHQKGGDEQFSARSTMGLWGAVSTVCALSSVAGYAIFGDSSPSTIAVMMAVAAGAILAMVAHTMIPEAFSAMATVRKAGKAGAAEKPIHLRIFDKVEAMAVVAGFLLTLILTKATR